jgi:16S rRNA G966 N2-methylase RsmD
MQQNIVDRRKNIHLYFPIYILPKIRENENYTLETLNFMAPILFSMHLSYQLTLMNCDVIIDACAGIGGNTMSFVTHSNVKKVISFEKNPYRYDMLCRNIDGVYPISKQTNIFIGNTNISKNVVAINADFLKYIDKYIDTQVNNVIYIDPPWLRENQSGVQYSKNDYILENIKINDMTLEDIIDKYLCKVKCIILKLPLKYVLKTNKKIIRDRFIFNFQVLYIFNRWETEKQKT